MTRSGILIVSGFLAVAAPAVRAGQLSNASFEIDFGPRETMNMWGDLGEAWGEAYQVNAGKETAPAKAYSGTRVLLINVPPNSWNGIWQQLPWEANKPFAWKARYLIKGGDLPESCPTFMKLEFYDGNDTFIGVLEGDRHRTDTHGQWESDSMKGVTPEGTAAIRFILIGGNNTDGAAIIDRIFWDDADTAE